MKVNTLVIVQPVDMDSPYIETVLVFSKETDYLEYCLELFNLVKELKRIFHNNEYSLPVGLDKLDGVGVRNGEYVFSAHGLDSIYIEDFLSMNKYFRTEEVEMI